MVYIFTDHETVFETMQKVNFGHRVRIILNKIEARNGTERIGKNLRYVSDNFRVLVNVQGDEPFVDPRNIDYVVKKHIHALLDNFCDTSDIFFSTLHQRIEDLAYLQMTSCVKIVVNKRNNAMLFSRNVVPWNKDGIMRKATKYYSCTGLYVYNRAKVEQYNNLKDTEIQIEEDVEQMKVLEHGFIIKSFECPYYNEISVNTIEDYCFLQKKYGIGETAEHHLPKLTLPEAVSDVGMES